VRNDEIDLACLSFVEAWISSTIRRRSTTKRHRTLTHDIFASDGIYNESESPSGTPHSGSGPGSQHDSAEDSLLQEIAKYYVEHGASSSTSSATTTARSSPSSFVEPPPVSKILDREEVLDLEVDCLAVTMEKLNGGDPGWCLGTFFHLYSGVAYHVLFSLLSGRPVIIAGGDQLPSRMFLHFWFEG
jgi:hypothetical protein